ncbi:unnamed protein product [Strongylus vulgaris]|uniref:Uncharacterized protein n=1 Tax=Strongylus vulgaris TaxID=40348 RepID=A0A3P7J6A0_STRVU|nr:unnamed protein product [Strongylus vulgaris]
MVVLLTWPTLRWASEEPENVELLLSLGGHAGGKPPLYFAVRHSGSSLRHDEANMGTLSRILRAFLGAGSESLRPASDAIEAPSSFGWARHNPTYWSDMRNTKIMRSFGNEMRPIKQSLTDRDFDL